jgi:uncharacterized glyoxalase superfamily protein PhnB
MAVKKPAKKASSKSTPSKGAKAASAKRTAPPRFGRAGAPIRGGAEALKLSESSPSFTVNDLQKSLAWYRDVLGFAVEERWEQEGKLMGVSLRAGSVTFMIAQDDWKKGRDRKKGQGFRLYCTTTQDVDALADGIKARGGKLEQEPRDQPWGSRDFALTDPDGFKITIGADTTKR